MHGTIAPSHERAPDPFAACTVASVPLALLAEGALWWAEERTLVVADLHLEKGSAFAARGQMLPPYDTIATLKRLAALVARMKPERVIALGDSFHDMRGSGRMSATDHGALATLTRAAEWIWIAGNHDPEPPKDLGGRAMQELTIGPIIFRHEPRPGTAPGEIAGHLHPSARIVGRGRSIRRRCFASDGRRLVMPAFGALAGGLNVLDEAFRPLFSGRAFHAFMLGESVHPVAGRRLVGG
ncbi:ligase-associated DNA damage response endonuclease PdeM [Kaistia dalseonensis]|uniref:DNA ligase-associated metallophosphoesterase n=1 Tax=Kaistia dalseonensis TaxID=410840 RepID=A0ABU0HF44_9HYPH|nr:ligase-associated DNA damage response endonuclease PdeM [Kaistia dalseonensis]MCX5497829.1 ligase-associated DNA damage response endonuclease PdeM [Kaistia dalseonensis]MDQ0440473.1 DNA ligase-associated metallophosphoesterase [Kaistia dalseonensis]